MNEIIESLYNRKSVRVYEEKAIPNEMKNVILEAAMQAPTAGCQQLYTILDITDQKLKKHLQKAATTSHLLQRHRWFWCFVQIVRSGMMLIWKQGANRENQT